tara:strand:- start:615 stop:1136 length:522 start_codon:yes stop_codon:yes gene_type:complete
MKLSLKNIKYSEHASQETNNFVAELYVDGKPFALVHNEGTGGCDMHHKHDKNPQSYSDFNQELNRIMTWHKENIQVPCEDEEKGWYAGCLESAVNDILVDHLIIKDVKKLMSRSMIVFEKGKKGFYKYGKKKYSITADRMGWFNNQMWQKFQENWVCINNMPIDEAVAYYKAN